MAPGTGSPSTSTSLHQINSLNYLRCSTPTCWVSLTLGQKCLQRALESYQLSWRVTEHVDPYCAGLDYVGQTKTISWMLMSFEFTKAMPGHQQPWYLLCEVGIFLSFLRVNLKTWDFSDEEWYKIHLQICVCDVQVYFLCGISVV